MFLGASHYILMNRVSQILQGGGHDVIKLLYEGGDIPGIFKINYYSKLLK